jgi:hypothetical protein
LKKEELAARALGVLIYGRRVHAPPPHYYYMYVFCTQGWIMHMQREQTDRPTAAAAAIVCASTLDKNMGSRKWNTQ